MRVIWSEEELRNFFDTLMFPLKEDEVYVIYMVARKKWGGISRSEEMLDWKVLRHYDFQKFKCLLKRFETPDDAYLDRNTNEPIPATAKGIYIDLQPKNVVRGVGTFLKEYVDDVMSGRLERIKYWDRRIFGDIHKSGKKKLFHIIDIDVKELSVLEDVINSLNVPRKEIWVTETHGGFHVIVPRMYGREVAKTREMFGNLSFVDFLKHNQTPVVGTVQGGFNVKRLPTVDTGILFSEWLDELANREITNYERGVMKRAREFRRGGL